jgi:hypothetical protein
MFFFEFLPKKDTLTLRKYTYKILPKIKFSKKEKWKENTFRKIDIASHKINIPFEQYQGQEVG